MPTQPRRTSRRTAVALALVPVAALALGACRSQTDASHPVAADGTTPQVKIMVGGIDKVIYLPAKLTDQLGYFKEQGITVDLATQQAGVNAENS